MKGINSVKVPKESLLRPDPDHWGGYDYFAAHCTRGRRARIT